MKISQDFLKTFYNVPGDNFRLVMNGKQEKYEHGFLLKKKKPLTVM